ncbi:Similar to Nelf-A: Negative elongation factor A (Drosophila melanogaster) [Cotesia congregata]|uniref:Similar to Nelf-A: Negative elongation factor A (Drosophila melanogaster) n=1 Tax=Cotesia congregata TaxID=51543 RepID=A0A8J2E3W0_COTCN|nr:Similar to Nelf-A: Negative elongation factor A (Drosophila melanogaster) [Cotesia congregata]
MANVRDSDTSLWLHNKLGISNDSWTGSSICSQLNAEVLRNIKDCFAELQTQVKLKLLLSFFHIPRRNVEETLPATGSLNTDISDLDEQRPIFSELVNDLRKLLKKQTDLTMLPLECHYLNKTALISVVGQQPAPTKHFTLKRKPKSAALRAELVQKSIDAANNMKKSTAPTVPVRSRGMPRKMTDTTPLKGIPSRVPTGGFRSPALTPSSMYTRTPISSRIRKDGGIKLLDITEQPLGYAQAKKRKRMLELEEQQKKVAEAQTAAQPLQQYPQHPVPACLYQQLQQWYQSQLQPPFKLSDLHKQSHKFREQMLEAQEMFRTANKVTRPEKALILGFMAGARTNPCPKLGNIVTVMLSENVEEVVQPDGTKLSMLVETHFQMNYTNGEWKRIKKNRRVVTEDSVISNAATATAAASN